MYGLVLMATAEVERFWKMPPDMDGNDAELVIEALDPEEPELAVLVLKPEDTPLLAALELVDMAADELLDELPLSLTGVPPAHIVALGPYKSFTKLATAPWLPSPLTSSG